MYQPRESQTTADHFAGIDLERYFRSVKTIRERSYAALFDHVSQFKRRGRWLDIGCSYGWLMQSMNARGFQCEGVEPSSAAAAIATASGLTVHHGLFPAAAPQMHRYDVLSFMDVLEHLDAPDDALASAAGMTATDGVLIIQVPDQECLLYVMAEWLHRCSAGMLAFAWRRLWLLDFDFPHQTYFTERGLRALLRRTGWGVSACWRSPIGSVSEALDRVAYATRTRLSQWANVATALAVGGIQSIDNACGHGGLMTVIAERQDARP